MKLAAASILVGTKPTVAEGVPILEEALKDAAGDRERTNIQLALALGYLIQDNYASLLEVSSALLKDEPESKLAFIDNALALMGLGRYDEALALADERLKLLENDSDALRDEDGDRSRPRQLCRGARLGAKTGRPGQGRRHAAERRCLVRALHRQGGAGRHRRGHRATEMQKDTPHILHTLACLYAEAGNTKDARDVLLRAMDDWNLDEPNDEFWYVLGRIAEQYGERDIAIADYRKLEKPKERLPFPLRPGGWRRCG